MIYLIIKEYCENWQSNNSKDIVFITTNKQKAIEQFEYIKQNHISNNCMNYSKYCYDLIEVEDEFNIKQMYWTGSVFHIIDRLILS